MIGKFLKEARGEKTLGQISAVTKIDKSYLSKVERDILIPKLDKLIPLSKAYGIKFSVLISKLLEISEEELVKLMLRDEKTEYAKNSLNEIKSLSESQRAMVKTHLKQLFTNKYQTINFTQNEEFLKELNIESNTANRWFRILNDYSLDDKFSEMLVLLAKSSENFFDDMNVVVKIKEAIALNLINSEELSQGIPCIIVSASKLFPKLKGLSLNSISLLSSELFSQINNISYASSEISKDISEPLNPYYKKSSIGSLAAFGGGTKQVEYTEQEAIESDKARDQFHYESMSSFDDEE